MSNLNNIANNAKIPVANHDSLLKLMINCKAEIIHSFSERKYNTA